MVDCGLSPCYYAGKEHKYNVLVIDLYGASLKDRLKQCGHFKLKTFVMLADQTLKRIEFLHRKGYLHRNLQPSKFIMGRNQTVKRVYILGLSLAKKWMKDNVHIPYKEGKRIKGNLIYQSINAHLQIELSRRDDL
jgi:serine/threonine protein kinase